MQDQRWHDRIIEHGEAIAVVTTKIEAIEGDMKEIKSKVSKIHAMMEEHVRQHRNGHNGPDQLGITVRIPKKLVVAVLGSVGAAIAGVLKSLGVW